MARREPGEPYYRVTIDEAADMYGDDNIAFVDVRGADEYLGGHVKNAISIPVDDLLSRVDDLPRDRKLFFICAQGVRSGLGCEMAAAMGIDVENLYNVEDGTGAWIDNGKPTSYGADL